MYNEKETKQPVHNFTRHPGYGSLTLTNAPKSVVAWL